MDPLKRIVELLEDESPRKRIAAAVVLGELKVKDAGVVAKLMAMAKDPLDAYAEAAVEALGDIGAMKALPVFVESLGRSRSIQQLASKAIAALGEEALPEIKARLDEATPEVRSQLSQLLPAVGGRQSFEMAVDGLLGQPWEQINKVALSVRAEARTMSEHDKKTMRTQVEKFVDKKKVQADELALRGALKILGYLELADGQETLLLHLGKKQPLAVRVEAITALRFALAKGPSKKALRSLIDLLEDADALLARSARDTLTVLQIGADFAEELAELSASRDVEVALWAIARLGTLAGSSKLAAKTLLPVARGDDRARAEAAAKVLATLPGGDSLLVEALVDAEEETGAQVLAEVLNPLATKLSKKDIGKLLEAGGAQLGKAFAVARRQLEPVRNANPAAWGEVLREKAKALGKKDPARAEAIAQLLGRSSVATPADRYGFAVAQFEHHSLDPHPRARQRDAVLAELEKLHASGFAVAPTIIKDKKVTDEARFYVGVHFAEKPQFELKNIGAEILEALAVGKSKIAKAAKNKMKLHEL